MRAILDTHTFLWWNMDDLQLSQTAREFIADGRNELYLSAVSAWEIALKYAKGRLKLPQAPDQYVTDRITLHRILSLPVETSHALRVYYLPDLHQDPFDRLLIAQSQLEDLPILTANTMIGQYEVSIIW
jgi:PIN domain nuclease of toxin-antitoxin system